VEVQRPGYGIKIDDYRTGKEVMMWCLGSSGVWKKFGMKRKMRS
jgi:hypothetical protein